ncbi:hypothetical protein [Sporolactobacillus putidus]
MNVKGMLSNYKLAKPTEQSFRALRRQLEYKDKWYGRDFITINGFFSSS